MQPSEEEILAALAHYRACVLQRNHAVFQRFIEYVEASALAAEEVSVSPSSIAKASQRFFHRLFYISRPENLDPSLQIDVPADVMTKWDALARAFTLDGAYVGSDEKRREVYREQYKNGIETELRNIDPELGFPADFEVLMGQVDSLEGHGWPQYREEGQQVRYWDGLGEDEGEAGDRVFDAEGDLGVIIAEEGWEVKAGWECGIGPETRCFIVYCREEEAGKEWGWRYGADQGQYGVEVLDNVVELLKWYEELYVPPLDYQLDSFMVDIFTC
ncbi:hypothetical protein F5Y11DRAFT_364799 [Daldinia sp. FL1419]|nr:hypothetical protein F5Y11DRAFT_364799 [Daldinia sp. FL1419]